MDQRQDEIMPDPTPEVTRAAHTTPEEIMPADPTPEVAPAAPSPQVAPAAPTLMARAQLWLVAYRPWLVVIFIPVLNAGLSLINKKALTQGMDFLIFCVYRNVVGFIVLIPMVAYYERFAWQQFTWRTAFLVLGLAIFEPVMDQNFTYAGLQKIPASLSSSFGLVQPAITFLFSCIFRYERVNLTECPSRAKVVGTCVAVMGAVVVAFSPGTVIDLPWTRGHLHPHNLQENTIDGIAFSVIAMLSASSYSVLLTRTLADFQSPLTIATAMCLMGALLNIPLALLFGSGRRKWIVATDFILLSYIYSGVMVSALATYLVSIVTRVRGPVFVAAFSPLSMVVVTAVGTLVFREQLYLTRLLAVFFIVLGMSLLLWGKARENRARLATQSMEQSPQHPAPEEV